MSRTEASTILAKVFAYLACDKRAEAGAWARKLIGWLETV